MPTIQQLKERRANAWSQMQEIRAAAEAAGRSELTAEEDQSWSKADTDIRKVSEDIEKLEREAELAGRMAEVEIDPIVNGGGNDGRDAGDDADKAYRSAFEGYVRGGMGSLEPEARKLVASRFSASPEMRALQSSTGAAGGYLVPTGFRNKVTETMKVFGGVRQTANVITTQNGGDLPWPTNDDTGNVGARLAQGTAMGEQDLAFGARELGSHTYTSKIVRVAIQLIQDEAIDIETFLPRKLGERLGRIQASEFTTGTGASMPEGVVTNATVGKTGLTGQTGSVIYDDLVDVEHSVDPAYRASGRCRFMLHDLSLAIVRKLKDSQGHPLWEPSVQAGVPSLLNGHPYTVNNDMPQMGASKRSILFGDFETGYIIRDVLDIQLMRLEERYAEYLQVAFLAFMRSDAMPDDAAAIRAYQNAAS